MVVPPSENSAIKKDPCSKRNLSVGFGTGQELAGIITSGGLSVIRDAADPTEEHSPTIKNLKELRESPMFD